VWGDIQGGSWDVLGILQTAWTPAGNTGQPLHLNRAWSMILQPILQHLPRKPVRTDLLLCDAPVAKRSDLNKTKKTLKCNDVGIADQQKAGKQGRDDNINSSVYNPTLHIFPH